jgi:predicted nucleic acid-binding protein
MREFFPDSMVASYQPLVAQMTNHPKDRHVLAAAVASRADYLVTFNLKDFISRRGASYQIVSLIGTGVFRSISPWHLLWSMKRFSSAGI